MKEFRSGMVQGRTRPLETDILDALPGDTMIARSKLPDFLGNRVGRTEAHVYAQTFAQFIENPPVRTSLSRRLQRSAYPVDPALGVG